MSEKICLLLAHRASRAELLRALYSAAWHFDRVLVGDAGGNDIPPPSEIPAGWCPIEVMKVSNRSLGANHNEMVNATHVGNMLMLLDHDDAYLPTVRAFLDRAEVVVHYDVVLCKGVALGGDTMEVVEGTLRPPPGWSPLWSMPSPAGDWPGWPRHIGGVLSFAEMLSWRVVPYTAVAFAREHWLAFGGAAEWPFIDDVDVLMKLTYDHGTLRLDRTPVYLYTSWASGRAGSLSNRTESGEMPGGRVPNGEYLRLALEHRRARGLGMPEHLYGRGWRQMSVRERLFELEVPGA